MLILLVQISGPTYFIPHTSCFNFFDIVFFLHISSCASNSTLYTGQSVNRSLVRSAEFQTSTASMLASLFFLVVLGCSLLVDISSAKHWPHLFYLTPVFRMHLLQRIRYRAKRSCYQLYGQHAFDFFGTKFPTRPGTGRHDYGDPNQQKI